MTSTICQFCSNPLTESDRVAYEAEGGSGYPSVHEDCAEMAELGALRELPRPAPLPRDMRPTVAPKRPNKRQGDARLDTLLSVLEWHYVEARASLHADRAFGLARDPS